MPPMPCLVSLRPPRTNPPIPITNVINPTIHPHDCPRWQQEHKQLQAMFPQFVTAHVAVPSPIPIYTNDRPISTWDGTTHTNIVYDDDDSYDGRTDYDNAYGDSFTMNNPSVQLQIQKMPPSCILSKVLPSHVPSQAPSLVTTKTPKQTHDDEH